MQKNRNGFTMIEMVFVIVVLGILAAIAVPRFAATRTDADITKGRSDIAAIRSAIVTERQGRIIQGCSQFIPNGTTTFTCPDGSTHEEMDNGGLFGGVLMYPIANDTSTPKRNGHWSATAGSGTYVFRVNNDSTTFIYNANDGTFNCTAGSNQCDLLTN